VIEPLRRSGALGEERIILASALMRHLRKRTNAQRLLLSTCKAGALPTELRLHALMSKCVASNSQGYVRHANSEPSVRTAFVQRLLFGPEALGKLPRAARRPRASSKNSSRTGVDRREVLSFQPASTQAYIRATAAA